MKKNKMLAIFVFIIASVALGGSIMSKAKSNDTHISKTAYQACAEYGEQYGICPELLMAVIETESGGNPKAENGNCKGLMQINPKWHKDRMKRLGVTNLFDERGNILVGADYLAELLAEYEASYALDIYNGNSKAKYNYENGILSEYAKKILERSAELEEIHSK